MTKWKDDDDDDDDDDSIAVVKLQKMSIKYEVCW